MNHFFANNRRLPAAEAESLFRKEQSEADLKNAVELLKRLSPAQAKRRDFIENLKKMSYWKRDVIETKIEEMKRRINLETDEKTKKVFTTKKSKSILAHSRRNLRVEDVLTDWGKRKDLKKTQLAEKLTPSFKPELNEKSLQMTTGRSKSFSKNLSRSSLKQGMFSTEALNSHDAGSKETPSPRKDAGKRSVMVYSTTLSPREGSRQSVRATGRQQGAVRVHSSRIADWSSNIYRPQTLNLLAGTLV